jgi:hypothetical protein
MKRIMYLCCLSALLTGAGCVVAEHRGGAYDGYYRGYGYGAYHGRDYYYDRDHDRYYYREGYPDRSYRYRY